MPVPAAVSAPVDIKGSSSVPMSTALSGLTAFKTICIFASAVLAATAPLVPASGGGQTYVDMGKIELTGLAVRFWYCIAIATTEGGGTATNGQTTQGIAYNNAGIPILRATNSGVSANPVYPAASFSKLNGSCVCLRHGSNTSGTAAGSTLTNYTKRDSTTNANVVTFDRANIVNNPTADASTLASTTWTAATIEVPSLGVTHMINQAVIRAANY